MVRSKAFFGWILSVTIMLLGGIATAQQNAGVAGHGDDGWRRTIDGWERLPQPMALLVTRSALPSSPRVQAITFPGSAHPAAWAGLQFCLSLLALSAFPAKAD